MLHSYRERRRKLNDLAPIKISARDGLERISLYGGEIQNSYFSNYLRTVIFQTESGIQMEKENKIKSLLYCFGPLMNILKIYKQKKYLHFSILPTDDWRFLTEGNFSNGQKCLGLFYSHFGICMFLSDIFSNKMWAPTK